MAVEVSTEDGFRHGSPRTLFEHPEGSLRGAQFDVHPDGDRFLLQLATEAQQAPPLRLVLNWPELLGR